MFQGRGWGEDRDVLEVFLGQAGDRPLCLTPAVCWMRGQSSCQKDQARTAAPALVLPQVGRHQDAESEHLLLEHLQAPSRPWKFFSTRQFFPLSPCQRALHIQPSEHAKKVLNHI